ncbi:MAG: FxsA family protein [Alphaproteobacteria bacterium]
MGLILLLAFIAVPIIEIALFIQAGELFGLWPTLGVVILTAIAGTWLLRWQGLATWTRATQSLQNNQFPIEEVFTGLCLVIAGALLLTPGFMTDTIGFALFLPPVRRVLAGMLRRRLQRGQGPSVWINGEAMDFSHRRQKPPDNVVDGEFQEVDPEATRLSPLDDDDTPPNPNSPWAGKS